MGKQVINVGSSANDGTGDPLRTAFNKINDNFTELYNTSAFDQQITISGNEISSNVSNANLVLKTSGTGVVEMEGIQIGDNAITGTRSNEDLVLSASGTGNIQLGAIKINGTTINSDTSSSITLAEAVDVTGAFTGTTASLSSTLAVTGTSSFTGAATFSGTAVIDNLTINDNIISSSSNADISIQPGGTGDVVLSALRVNGTTLDSSDSSKVTIAEALDITGAVSAASTLAVTGAATLSSTLTVTGTSTFNDGVTAESLTTNVITSNGSNAEISIQPSGTGDVIISALRFNGTTIDSSDSSLVTIAENTNITGTLTTADITTTGNVSISGSLSPGTLAIGDLNIIADGTITSDTNGDIVIDPAGTGEIVLTGPITHAGTQTTTGQLNVDNLRFDGNTISATSGSITLDAGANTVTSSSLFSAGEINATLGEFTTLRADTIQNDTSNGNITISAQGTGVVSIGQQLTLTGSFLPAIHTFTATDSITVAEHAGRTLLLGEVGGNALVTLTLPDATGSGATYKFIVSVANTSNYVIKVPDADNTIDGIMLYLDEDGTAVSAFPTVAASDTITLNGGTTGGIVGDYLEIVDIAADQYHVRGVMRVAAGANPATPFSATVS